MGRDARPTPCWALPKSADVASSGTFGSFSSARTQLFHRSRRRSEGGFRQQPARLSPRVEHVASGHMPESLKPLLVAEFPPVIVTEGWGRWWKVHSDAFPNPWFFASDTPDREFTSIGRFDLPPPYGTLYVGGYLPGVTPESVRETGVTPAESQAAYNNRRLSVMPLDAYHGLAIADFTSKAVTKFGAPADIAALPRAEARPWAVAAHEGGFAGIRYRLREDPKHRLGLALFGNAGEAEPPAGQLDPLVLPVGLRNEVLALFEGEYRGDPVPK